MSGRGVFPGIDFGTSNSSVAYVIDDPRQAKSQIIDVKTVDVSQDEDSGSRSHRMPTIVSVDFDEKKSKSPLIGWQFHRQFRATKKRLPLLRHGEDFFRSVKSDLGSFRIYPKAFHKDFNTPEAVAAAIVRFLLQEAKRGLPGYSLSEARVRLTVPASLSAIARGHTKAAAAQAGLKEEQFELIDEPVAALVDLLNASTASLLFAGNEPRNIAIFDYGGGTLDISLVQAQFDAAAATGLKVENLAISNYNRLGGDMIDAAVMEKVVWPQIEGCLGMDHGDLPADVRRQIEDTLTPTLARELKEVICRKVAARLNAGSTLEDIRECPIAEVRPIVRRELKLPDVPARLPAQVKITSDQFEDLMAPYLEEPELDDDDRHYDGSPRSLLAPVFEAVEKAGIEPHQLDALVLHGGSCRNPYLRQLVQETFANQASLFASTQILETPDLDASVARGAALSCYWKHARGQEIVPPIIAEEIGIITLNDRPEPLVRSGASLPFPDEDALYEVPTTFYVPKDGIRTMLVPFYSGRQQRVAGSVKVPLPSNVKRGDPIRISLRVEPDKTLYWCVHVAGQTLEPGVLQDPWTPKETTEASRELMEHRRCMRDTLLATGTVPRYMRMQELGHLWACRESGEPEEFSVLLADLADEDMDSNLANYYGLLCSWEGDRDGQIRWYQKAADLEPNDAVLRGNLGCGLANAGRYDEAIAHWRAALGINPKLIYVYERLGDLYRQRGDEAAAVRELREAVRLAEKEASARPDSSEPWLMLSRLYTKIGEYEKSHEARRRANAARRNQVFEGDSTEIIAGPDSGIVSIEEDGI
jgi:molecular chaperone DnaK (HSP70)